MIDPADKSKTQAERHAGEPEFARGRRRWHAPQFMLTEIALTDADSTSVSDSGGGES